MATLVTLAALPCAAQQQTAPGQTSTYQQKKDVPQQQGPGTENPDLTNPHNTPPPSSNSSSTSTVKHRKRHHPKAAGTTETTTSGR